LLDEVFPELLSSPRAQQAATIMKNNIR